MILNIHFFIMFFISCVTFLCDILIYTFCSNYYVALTISFIIVSAISFIFLKKNIMQLTSDFQKLDLVFIILLLMKLFVSINNPDSSYDVKMYHIYLQENPFIDKIHFDFFPGRTLNSFLFPLGDRMHYIFRSLLGYRFRKNTFLL